MHPWNLTLNTVNINVISLICFEFTLYSRFCARYSEVTNMNKTWFPKSPFGKEEQTMAWAMWE